MQSADAIICECEATSKSRPFRLPAEWDTIQMQQDRIPRSPTVPNPPQLGEVFVFCDQPWDIRSRKEGRKEGRWVWAQLFVLGIAERRKSQQTQQCRRHFNAVSWRITLHCIAFLILICVTTIVPRDVRRDGREGSLVHVKCVSV